MFKSKLYIFFFLLLTLPLSLSAKEKGISYTFFSKGRFTSVHVLIVDPREYSIIPVKADEKAGRETVAALAYRYGAIAAVNGGFWKLDGRPAGALKINHKWYGTPVKFRGAIGWSDEGNRVLIDRISTNYILDHIPDEEEIEILPLSDPAHTTPEEWRNMEHIVGGAPMLVRDGNLVQDHSSEQTLRTFLVERHSRTAIGIRETGEWAFVVVNGSFYSLLGGMNIEELANLMLDLGCVEAVNLDGGRSSTMLYNGSVINNPYGPIEENGKYVQAVSDAILIRSR